VTSGLVVPLSTAASDFAPIDPKSPEGKALTVFHDLAMGGAKETTAKAWKAEYTRRHQGKRTKKSTGNEFHICLKALLGKSIVRMKGKAIIACEPPQAKNQPESR
jgi:hypothetical protein